MAYDETLAARIRTALARRKGITEVKMFGGLGFLLNGNMCVGVRKDDMIVRLAPEETDAALAEPHVQQFAISGKPMKGWVLVGLEALKTETELGHWIKRSSKYVETLPAK